MSPWWLLPKAAWITITILIIFLRLPIQQVEFLQKCFLSIKKNILQKDDSVVTEILHHQNSFDQGFLLTESLKNSL